MDETVPPARPAARLEPAASSAHMVDVAVVGVDLNRFSVFNVANIAVSTLELLTG